MDSGSKYYDVLIIGSGCAGLSLALKIKNQGRIAVLAKSVANEGSTFYAQGGISAVLDAKDSNAAHIADTLTAGAGLCDPDIVALTVSQGKKAIEWLIDQGVSFTEFAKASGDKMLHLHREGGHSYRRIVHTADATGKAVQQTLLQAARQHPSITLFEHHNVVDLVLDRDSDTARVCGAYVLDIKAARVLSFRAPVVVLASGGASKVYLYSTNPQIATGDGIAVAWRAGCQVANMEFMQFHPTCLYHPHGESFLISEAVRGEGGRLVLPDGHRFMGDYDARMELAPRDIVARAIDHEMKKRGLDCVYLDISHKSPLFIEEHFPTIYQRCLALGIDMAHQPIPVVPAAHYTCGGVVTDAWARTSIPGLYAIGEVAYTGLHGANRMASNSLLECLVFAEQAAEDIRRVLPQAAAVAEFPPWDESQVADSDEEVVVAHNWDELRRFMWDYVGIVRTDKRLLRALRRVELLKAEIAEYYSHFRVTSDLLELRNLVIVAELIIRCALARKESRGLHFSLDYPPAETDAKSAATVLTPSQTSLRP
ncbi:MAG: L-aspartate oxidase [Methylococcales bacterium]|nr:L-aspartate oxidase [Methylococcales bacterium]